MLVLLPQLKPKTKSSVTPLTQGSGSVSEVSDATMDTRWGEEKVRSPLPLLPVTRQPHNSRTKYVGPEPCISTIRSPITWAGKTELLPRGGQQDANAQGHNLRIPCWVRQLLVTVFLLLLA